MSGGGGGGGGESSSSTTTVQNYSPEESEQRVAQLRRLNALQAEAERIYNTTAGSLANSAYPGSRVAPISPETVEAQNALLNYARSPQLAGMVNNMQNATMFGLHDVLYPSSNPALQATIDAAIRPIWYQYTDPEGAFSAVRTASTNMGHAGGGSSREQIAQGITAARGLQAMADTSAKIASENYQKGLDTFTRTLALSPQTMQMGSYPAQLVGAVGGQNEAFRQALEDYGAAERYWNINREWMPLYNYANLLYGGSTGVGGPTSTTSTTTGQLGRGSSAGSMLGSAFSGWSLGSSLAGTEWGAALLGSAAPYGGLIGAGLGLVLGGLFS